MMAVTGWRALLYKETLRFWKVGFQTVGAPVLTALLYLMVFGHVLEDHVKVYGSVGYTAFLVPGLVMMSVLQNAFANSSSSIIQSKIMGNLVFVLLTPLSHWGWFFAYVGSSIIRGLAVGLGVFVVTVFFAMPNFVAPVWIVVFALLGAGDAGHAGPHRRPLGREVRPDGGVPELPDHAHDLPVGRVLFDRLAAAVLAEA
jgi:ABC-2 type transport system permease protein